MTVSTLTRSTPKAIGKRLATLALGDVLIIGQWRVTVGLADARPYWLQGHGHVFLVERSAKSAAELGHLIAEHTPQAALTALRRTA